MIYVDQRGDDQGNWQKSMLARYAVMVAVVSGAPLFRYFPALGWRGYFPACVWMYEAFDNFIVHDLDIVLGFAWHGLGSPFGCGMGWVAVFKARPIVADVLQASASDRWGRLGCGPEEVTDLVDGGVFGETAPL